MRQLTACIRRDTLLRVSDETAYCVYQMRQLTACIRRDSLLRVSDETAYCVYQTRQLTACIRRDSLLRVSDETAYCVYQTRRGCLTRTGNVYTCVSETNLKLQTRYLFKESEYIHAQTQLTNTHSE